MSAGYVLDSFAVMAWLKGSEPSASVVNEILLCPAPVFMSAINIGEVIYTLQKRFGPEHADVFLRRLPNLPIEIVTPALQDILEAAAVKARYPIAYADAFAAQLAIHKRVALVTGDPEFRVVEGIEILWLEADA